MTKRELNKWITQHLGHAEEYLELTATRGTPFVNRLRLLARCLEMLERIERPIAHLRELEDHDG